MRSLAAQAYAQARCLTPHAPVHDGDPGALLNLPGLHKPQFLMIASEYRPGGQAEQLDASLERLYHPAVHVVHDFDPESCTLTDHSGQSVQPQRPASSWYCPLGHGRQLVAELLRANWPAGQARQALDPAWAA